MDNPELEIITCRIDRLLAERERVLVAIDGSCAPGLFPLVSVPTVAGCIGAALIIIAAVATPIAKTQRAREIWFYIMSGGAMAKIVTMELARMIG